MGIYVVSKYKGESRRQGENHRTVKEGYMEEVTLGAGETLRNQRIV